MKKNNKALIIMSIIIIAILIVACIIYILLNNTGRINQGFFRTNDVLIKSIVSVEEKQDKKEESMISDLSLDLSQKNTISMLIPKEEEIKDIYIDSIKLKAPKTAGQMYLSQPNSNDKVIINQDIKNEKVNIYTEDKDNQYLVEIEIDNSNFARDVKVPENTRVVKFDGTLISLTGMNVEDLMFKISFDLNIVDKQDKISTCSIDLKLPGYELANAGIAITHGKLNDYVFYLRDNFLFNIRKYLKF